MRAVVLAGATEFLNGGRKGLSDVMFVAAVRRVCEVDSSTVSTNLKVSVASVDRNVAEACPQAVQLALVKMMPRA